MLLELIQEEQDGNDSVLSWVACASRVNKQNRPNYNELMEGPLKVINGIFELIRMTPR